MRDKVVRVPTVFGENVPGLHTSQMDDLGAAAYVPWSQYRQVVGPALAPDSAAL
jgi:hypothetical protein